MSPLTTNFVISGVKRISGSYLCCLLNSPLLLHTHSVSLGDVSQPSNECLVVCHAPYHEEPKHLPCFVFYSSIRIYREACPLPITDCNEEEFPHATSSMPSAWFHGAPDTTTPRISNVCSPGLS